MTCEAALARAEALAVAQAVLLGRLGVLDAAHRLAALQAAFADTDPDVWQMVGVASETDLPLGSVRELWDPEALAEKDREIAAAEVRWGDTVRRACERIADRLGPTVLGDGAG